FACPPQTTRNSLMQPTDNGRYAPRRIGRREKAAVKTWDQDLFRCLPGRRPHPLFDQLVAAGSAPTQNALTCQCHGASLSRGIAKSADLRKYRAVSIRAGRG